MRNFFKGRKGAPLVEYTVLMGMLSIILVPFVFNLGNETRKSFEISVSTLSDSGVLSSSETGGSSFSPPAHPGIWGTRTPSEEEVMRWMCSRPSDLTFDDVTARVYYPYPILLSNSTTESSVRSVVLPVNNYHQPNPNSGFRYLHHWPDLLSTNTTGSSGTFGNRFVVPRSYYRYPTPENCAKY